jgi:superfamily II DNA/RNA helicase
VCTDVAARGKEVQRFLLWLKRLLISGSRSSTARLRAHISTLFDFFRSFFVCLGLDIPSVSTVVHYDVARSVDTFVHRSGRTAVS